MKCEIRWIDENGKPSDDQNEAIQLTRIKRYYSHNLERLGAVNCWVDNSPWYAICAEHSKQLRDPGMEIWEVKPLETE